MALVLPEGSANCRDAATPTAAGFFLVWTHTGGSPNAASNSG